MVIKVRCKLLPIILLAATAFLSSIAYGGGMALSGVGAKAIGMGGAFRGLADDWSACYWNPAGLAQLEKSELGLVLSVLSPRPEFAPNITYDGYDVGYLNGATRYPKDKNNMVPNLSGFIKFPAPRDFTAGLAIFVPYALGSEWDLFDPIYPDIVAPYPAIDHKSDLRVVDIHPSIAKAFAGDKLLFGAGISFMRGKIEYQKAFLNATTLPRPHDNVAIDARIEGDGWGYGANFGLLYKFSDKLQFGISGKTPTTIKFDGTLTNNLYGFYNIPLKEYFLQNVYNALDSARIRFLFPDDQEVTSWRNNAAAELKLPADIGIGIAYRKSDKLLMTLDLAYTLWERLDSIVIDVDGQQSPIDPSPAADVVVRTKWENTLRLSLGTEYRMREQIRLRGGFYYDPSPIPDQTFSPLIPDMGAKYSGNIGAAVDLRDGWQIAYTFEYVKFAAREITTHSGTTIDSGIVYDNYPGSYKQYFVASFLSATYRF